MQRKGNLAGIFVGHNRIRSKKKNGTSPGRFTHSDHSLSGLPLIQRDGISEYSIDIESFANF